jgi:tRNA guanosine-2'-O-methyltransferase
VFRTWFQWVSQAVLDGIQLDCLQDPFYWDIVRTGLLHGHADQRKYCIGIIRQSLLAAQSDIDTPTMQFRVTEPAIYLKAYEQYAALYEIIVLDRYVNQVQACVPELTRVFQSKVTPLMASTLLSAALNPLVQDGVRKVIGNWYMDYVTKIQGDIEGHVQFLLTGFLPWATLGDLFTSTLTSTRDSTTTTHGISLTNVIARFVSATQDASPPAGTTMSTTPKNEALVSGRRQVVLGVVDFIIDAGGRIFQYCISYLLEGLVNGLHACHAEFPLQQLFNPIEASKISRISRLPCLPEIASDLYSEYCRQILDSASPGWTDMDGPAYRQIRIQKQRLIGPIEPKGATDGIETSTDDMRSLEGLLKQLDISHHLCIQDEKFVPMCKAVINILNHADPALIRRADLFTILEAFWEEADRRQFCRPVAVHIPSLLFHPTCVRVYVQRQTDETGVCEDNLHALLSRAVDRLQRLSEGRTYVLSLLVTSVRRAILSCPELIDVLPVEDYILRFINNPPTTKSEFMFEVAAAEKLQQYQSHRSYCAYYGQREWHAYAAMIDLIQRFPQQYVAVTKNILDRLIEPWKDQTSSVPILSKWKNVLQLQTMLLLADFCLHEQDADAYLAIFNHALVVEPWPRFRFLLEWIIARIYNRFPGRSSQILEDLGKLDDSSSTKIASLMKLGVLVAPRESERFSAKLMTQLVPFSASPKVQIRHESNYAIPIVFDLARSRGWRSIIENPAFVSLNNFIRSLDKFQVTPWTIRTLRLDAVEDFTLVNIFQGQYLTIESPEKARVAYEDFVALHEADRASDVAVPPERIGLGTPLKTELVMREEASRVANTHAADTTNPISPAFFQTKSGFDMDSLHPQCGPPSKQNQRPASVILVASLIDNPTNLGGLSRISESFGLEALYIADLKQMAHKDFKATSVTSEKHFPICELKVVGVPAFLIDMKRSGYEIVGIEQTDRSGILGTDGVTGDDPKTLGILPKKCVLVLGSEKGGISAEVLAALDRCVEIRTVGVTRSLSKYTITVNCQQLLTYAVRCADCGRHCGLRVVEKMEWHCLIL